MRKAIILIIALLLIPNSLAIIKTTFAQNATYSTNSSAYFICAGYFPSSSTYICNSFNNASAFYTSQSGAGGSIQISATEVNITASNSNGANAGTFMSGFTSKKLDYGTACDFQIIKYNSGADTAMVGFDDDAGLAPTDGTVLTAGTIDNPGDGAYYFHYGNNLWSGGYGSGLPVNEVTNVTIVMNASNKAVYYINNGENGETLNPGGSQTAPYNFTFQIDNQGVASSIKYGLRYFACYNSTTGAPQQNTGAPKITSYNMQTPSGDCTNWNTDKSNACITSDTTPTVTITTDKDAYCAIGVSNLNYTGLNTSNGNRTCTGTRTQSHICTIITQDALTEENSSVYIGCKDLSGNENSTSTSGALKVYIHTSDFEAQGRDAIGSGISNALSSGYTIYTSQRIYARNSANSQATGIFDKVVKKLNKIWAFNIITGNETYANVFNITPTLHTLEMRNISSYTINSTVYQFILDTQ